MGLLSLRNTPVIDNATPANLLMNRQVRHLIPAFFINYKDVKIKKIL